MADLGNTGRPDCAPIVKRARRLAKPDQWATTVGFVALALTLGFLAQLLGTRTFDLPTSRISSPSALALLTAIGTGMLAFTGVVLSLMLVALQFGASVYGPWLVGALQRSSLVARALGVFTGTFLYAALAIPSVDLAGAQGVNALVVWVSFAWLLASTGMLLRLVPALQRMSIVAVLDELGRRGREAIGAVYRPGVDEAGASTAAASTSPTQVIRHLGAPAFLLAVDERALVQVARASKTVLHIPRAIGERIQAGDPLATFPGGDGSIAEDRVRRAIVLGSGPLLLGNPHYALRLLVDIAIRGLSPAINDPTTAVHALDQIEGLLRLLAGSRLDDGEVRDSDGTLRLVLAMHRWEDLLGLALTEIQHFGRNSPQIQARLNVLLHGLAEQAPEARRPAIQKFIAMARQ